MNEAKYPSKERIERDGVLIYAEGDDLVDDPEEAKRQGYRPEDAKTVTVSERLERDGVLVAVEGDELSVEKANELGIGGTAAATKVDTPAAPAKKAPAKRTSRAAKKS